MLNRIIEIASDNQKLSVYRGFLRIEKEGNIADIPLNSVCAIFVTAHQIVYTQNLLQRLCEENIPLLILGQNYMPSGLLLSFVGQQRQMEVQYLQIAQKKPIYKQIWQAIIQEKIKNQASVLDYFELKNPIKDLHKLVLSADSDNKEGYSARLYFKSLFGTDFIRDRTQEGINSYLNYGYAIIRAALARYVVASGLNPAFGVAHHNKMNPFCLVDDLIEPFRPVVDLTVYKLLKNKGNLNELTSTDKATLSGLLTTSFRTKTGESPLYMLLQQEVWDLVHIYKTGEVNFQFSPYLFDKELIE